jgi:hypothetical protein
MENITVVVKPHHLKGNTWSHGGGEGNRRRCPLHEALVEDGHNDVNVLNAIDVHIGDQEYEIEGRWSDVEVDPYIQAANEGSDKEYTVILKPVPKEKEIEVEV